MKLILVDDSLIELNLFATECAHIDNAEIIGMFSEGPDAITFCREHPEVEVALLDIDMPGMNGITLAGELRKIRSDMIIIFVTGHTEFAADAVRQKADYILFKPFDREDVLDALERAQLMHLRQSKPMYAVLFGSFEFIVNNRHVKFRSSKAKELLALLLCKEGFSVSIHEIVDCLWDGDDTADVRSVGYRKAIKNLADTLADYGVEDLLERSRGFCRLRLSEVDSDYFRFLRGEESVYSSYQGKFLPEYPWAESYVYRLDEIKERRRQAGKDRGLFSENQGILK